MSTYKIVLTDHIFPDFKLEKGMLSNVNAELIAVPNGADLAPYLADADVVVNTYIKLDEKLICQMRKCRLIIRNGIGVDTIDVKACTEHGIMVANIPNYCSDEAAAHTMMLILAVTKKLKLLDRTVQAGSWDVKAAIPAYSLQGKILGLMGFGKIPRLVAGQSRAFGLELIAYDPFVQEEEMERYSVGKVDFDQLISESDIVSIHCPLNASTRALFDRDVFDRMKQSAFLINVARGAIVKEDDLIEALQQGKIAGAGLDVLEGPQSDSARTLASMDQVLVTPHTAWYSEESMVRRRTQTMESVLAVLQGKMPQSPCNHIGAYAENQPL